MINDYDMPDFEKSLSEILLDHVAAANLHEIQRREHILEDFLSSGAMMRDITQVVERRFTGLRAPTEPFRIDDFGCCEFWRVN